MQLIVWVPPLLAKDIQIQEKVAQLIGSKCTIKCNIYSYAVDALLDMGAQVSILDHQWVKTYHPDHRICPLSELIGKEALGVLGVNGKPLPYNGWIGVSVSLPGHSKIKVPLLSTCCLCAKERWQPPIVHRLQTVEPENCT